MRITRTRRGVRLEQGGAVLSEVLAAPGPTHSIFDVLAAAVASMAPGPRAAVLGFAAGGLVAPLRAMGYAGALHGVDLDLAGERIFRELSATWAGEVTVTKDDAVLWLRRQRTFDAIVEDLSELGTEGETKPLVSVTALPPLVARKLRAGGVAITNLLPVPGVSWRALIAQAAAPWARRRADAVAVIHVDGFENRILVAGGEAPREVGARVRAQLRDIRSEITEAIYARGLRSK